MNILTLIKSIKGKVKKLEVIQTLVGLNELSEYNANLLIIKLKLISKEGI